MESSSSQARDQISNSLRRLTMLLSHFRVRISSFPIKMWHYMSVCVLMSTEMLTNLLLTVWALSHNRLFSKSGRLYNNCCWLNNYWCWKSIYLDMKLVNNLVTSWLWRIWLLWCNCWYCIRLHWWLTRIWLWWVCLLSNCWIWLHWWIWLWNFRVRFKLEFKYDT